MKTVFTKIVLNLITYKKNVKILTFMTLKNSHLVKTPNRCVSLPYLKIYEKVLKCLQTNYNEAFFDILLKVAKKKTCTEIY